MNERAEQMAAPADWTVDVYTRSTPEALALAHNLRARTRDAQLAHFDSLAESWRTVGYLVAWIAPGVMVASDAVVPLTVRGMAVARDSDTYPMAPQDALSLVGSADPVARLGVLHDRYARTPEGPEPIRIGRALRRG
jgi:hypothetical protein